MEIRYSQGSFHAGELVKYLNLTDQGKPIYYQLIKMREVVKKAEALNLTVSEDDLQTFVDNFRISLGLHSAEDTYHFLSQAGLNIEDLEQFCHSTLLIETVKKYLADDDKIEAYFVNNRAEFDLARVSTTTIKEENLANEIIMQVTEDGEDFHSLARTHSIDEATKYAGGYVGFVSRNAFSAEISAKVFNAQIKDLLGPFPVDAGFQLILMEELIKPDLNDRLKTLIREKIFEGWASQFIQAGIQFKEKIT